VRVEVPVGGGSIHNGRLWHGSGPNRSATLPRRGLGIHYIPAEATFDLPEGLTGGLFAPHRLPGSDVPPDGAFPCHWL
jgi:ectoine hydroxylase-related dioxygenase (phytanoyl-CoA dioxygenase family)